jgi:hypothetical protein
MKLLFSTIMLVLAWLALIGALIIAIKLFIKNKNEQNYSNKELPIREEPSHNIGFPISKLINKSEKLPNFFAKKILTRSEQILFIKLVEALPECIIFSQVQISQIVKIDEGNRRLWQTWFNKISRKSADYVICLKDNFDIVAVIELDDPTHERQDRKKADADKDTALNGAGYKIIRWKSIPDVQTIRRIFTE